MTSMVETTTGHADIIGAPTPDFAASLGYANGVLPMPWVPSARFTVSFAALQSPQPIDAAKLATY